MTYQRAEPEVRFSSAADMFQLGTHGLFLAALSLLPARISCSFGSVPDVPDIAAYFGTKTRYEEVKPNLLRDPLTVNTSILRPPPGELCTPVHLTAVIRHGSRYPTVKNIRRIHRLSEIVQKDAARTSESSTVWLQELRKHWEQWFTEDMDGKAAFNITFLKRNMLQISYKKRKTL